MDKTPLQKIDEILKQNQVNISAYNAVMDTIRKMQQQITTLSAENARLVSSYQTEFAKIKIGKPRTFELSLLLSSLIFIF